MRPPQTNLRGAGFCPRCGWGIDIHPFDFEGIDVGRCPTPEEQQSLRDAPDLYAALVVARDFPRAERAA